MVVSSALVVTRRATALPPPASKLRERRSNVMVKSTKRNERSGSKRAARASATTPPEKSTTSAPRSNGSNKPWSLPLTVRQFTSQANNVATMLLNDEIDVETTKVYSALARTIAQTVTAEVQRARSAKSIPDLDFEEYN